MPSFNAEDQVVIAGDEDWNPSMFGLPSLIVGMALSSISFKPTRQNETITGHNAQELLHIGKTPSYTAEVSGKSLLEGGVFGNAAPFQPITRAAFGNYIDGSTNHGCPDTGFFIVWDVTDDAPAGSFRDSKITVKLVTTWIDNVSEVLP